MGPQYWLENLAYEDCSKIGNKLQQLDFRLTAPAPRTVFKGLTISEFDKMVRKLKHHEQKLLKKTDFITYKQVRSQAFRPARSYC